MTRVIKIYEPGEIQAGRPLAGFLVHAAFESPGTDYEEGRICLDEYVTDHPEAVYYIKTVGGCMEYSGIEDDDIQVVDRSLTRQNGDVILGVLNGQHVIACYIEFEDKSYLIPDNPKATPYKISQYDEFTIEGVVSYSVLDQRKQNHVRVNRLQQLLRILRTGLSA
jgi:DNA polymerase V